MAMADPDEDEVALSHLGIVNSAPFDWGGDTPQDVATPSSSKTGRLLVDQMPSNNTSGLDSLKKFLNSNDINNGHQKSKDLLRTLLGSHNISISPESPVSQSAATADNSESRYNQVLIGDIASRDVSIRGLSDRAVAELTCEGKTSIIASILRLFDMDRESSSITYDKKKLWPPPQPIQKDPMIMDAPRLSTAEIVRSVHLTASPGDILRVWIRRNIHWLYFISYLRMSHSFLRMKAIIGRRMTIIILILHRQRRVGKC